MKKLFRVILVLYTFMLIYWMFFGFSRVHTVDYKYNLVLFSTLRMYIEHFDHFPFVTWIVNVGGNIFVFVPFGILLPLCFPRLKRTFPFLTTFLVGITLLETCQLLWRVGSFDVDDILLNTIGALLGFILIRTFLRVTNANK
jgi:glycopeptide antibiotics resistance protein